jgi:transcriptional regulator with XRE-family HTH domain
MNPESIHHRLKRLRQEADLSAKVMAQKIGVPQSTYLDWENGRGMKLPPFQKISQVLAISVTELVTGEKPPLQSVSIELEKVELLIREIRAQLSSVI